MEIVNAPSINHALEFFLLELGNEIGREKPVVTEEQRKIRELLILINKKYSEFINKSKGNRKKEEMELFGSLNELQKLMGND